MAIATEWLNNISKLSAIVSFIHNSKLGQEHTNGRHQGYILTSLRERKYLISAFSNVMWSLASHKQITRNSPKIKMGCGAEWSINDKIPTSVHSFACPIYT